jgi:hypothetical protein
MSKGGSGSSMTQGGGQSSFGGQMPMQQQGYQSTFGNQNYRSQPSQPTFNNYSYQQPGQFGGQIMNQSARSPGSKGGYSAPVMQQPMRSPGGKGGYQPPMRQQMPSPGGKGRSYQPPPTPYGYGQSTFNPGQFGGYGQPSNMFSFSSPHYQPYVPPVYEPPPPPPPPYRGDDPRDSGVTSSPPSTGSKGGTQRPVPDYSSSGVTGYQPSFGRKGGYYQSAEQPMQPQPINLPAVQPLPVMPKPTMPSREVPVFPSVGGIGGNKQPTGGPQTLMQGEQNQYGTAEDELMERQTTWGPESLNTSLLDMLRKFSGGIGSLMGPSGLPGRSESFTPPSPVAPPIQNETAAKNFWSQAQKAMDSGSLADADRFLRQYESITGTRNPMYGLSALDPSGYQSAIANR